MFEKRKLKELLQGYDSKKVDVYLVYCDKLATEKKDGKIKNFWMSHKTDEELANYYKSVALDGLHLDGKNITLQNRGIDYNYKAYKNKMLIVYPESIVDVQLVYKDDDFSFSKESGHVIYSHKINNPFGNKDENIIGGYCVIKNKRGEFLTTLSHEEIEYHRKIAKTDGFWRKWYSMMNLKTIIKKACGMHFEDIYQNIETIDNDNYDLTNSLELPIEAKQEIEEIKTTEDLAKYYNDNKDKYSGIKKDFIKECAKRKEQIQEGF